MRYYDLATGCGEVASSNERSTVRNSLEICYREIQIKIKRPEMVNLKKNDFKVCQEEYKNDYSGLDFKDKLKISAQILLYFGPLFVNFDTLVWIRRQAFVCGRQHFCCKLERCNTHHTQLHKVFWAHS